MTDNVARVASVPQLNTENTVPASPPQSIEAKNDNTDPGRYRLSIEAVAPNRFVYKVVDRVTGEVIRQLPREEVEKLISDPTYRGGRVVKTSV